MAHLSFPGAQCCTYPWALGVRSPGLSASPAAFHSRCACAVSASQCLPLRRPPELVPSVGQRVGTAHRERSLAGHWPLPLPALASSDNCQGMWPFTPNTFVIKVWSASAFFTH